MTVTDQRREYVVAAVTAHGEANREFRRAFAVDNLTEEMVEAGRRALQDVVDLDVTADEVAELAAYQQLARERLTAPDAPDGVVEQYREVSLALHHFRVAWRQAEIAAGNRNPATTASVTGGTVDFGTESPS